MFVYDSIYGFNSFFSNLSSGMFLHLASRNIWYLDYLVKTIFNRNFGVTKWIANLISKQKVVCSNPTSDNFTWHATKVCNWTIIYLPSETYIVAIYTSGWCFGILKTTRYLMVCCRQSTLSNVWDLTCEMKLIYLFLLCVFHQMAGAFV